MELLGGVEQFCSKGEKLLLKPNLLLGDRPDRGSTTHPEFFHAVGSLFQSAGIKLSYGDSPGFGSPSSASKSSGLFEAGESLGINLADFVNTREVDYPEGILLKKFLVASGIFDVDGMINLPKFKTHALTRMTGAVKNLFGCLPGVQKATFHARLPEEKHFSEMLVDLANVVFPRLHIMDGIIGMEGNGPRNGKVRAVGLILISTNPHALDHCVARLMDLPTALVPTLKVANEFGFYQPDAIHVLGESLESLVMKDYDVNRSKLSTTGPKGFYMDVFKNWVTPRPVIDEMICSQCGRCVSICPAVPRAVDFRNGRKSPPTYHYQDCIRCYCCQEMCPDEAISIKTPLLGQFFNKIKL
jgi:uncharacterized protein (DUF362 family)/NAD-dependent dihydropyrimidine dehydrogenase PreA subunit